MRTVVTGATGYIGGHLLREVLSRGWPACAVVHESDTTPLPAGVTRVIDPGTAEGLARALGAFKPDAIMHLAASQRLTDGPDDSDALIEANVAFGGRVLSAARAAGARALVCAGTYSAHALGSADYVPQTLYAASKWAFLGLAEYYRTNTPLRTVMLELSDTYGPGDDRPKFLNLIAAAAQSREPLGASPGDQEIRPLHVDDIVEAFIIAADLLLDGATLAPTHSVAGAETVTLHQLVEVFERATGATVPIIWGTRPHRPREIMRPWQGDPLPGWQPRVDLLEGLRCVYGPRFHAEGCVGSDQA